jgi:hypothetical protein
MRFPRLLLVLLVFSVTLMAADSPFSGTWKFDPTKGNLTPPIPKSVVAHIDANDTDFKFKQEGVDDKDQPMNVSYEAKFDGNAYPVTGDPSSDSVLLKRINQREVKFTNKKSGKVVSVTDVVISKDGKTATVNYTDYDSAGKATKGVAIYQKE